MWAAVAVLLVVMSAYAWMVDFITLEGERTVYTVDCAGGVWTGHDCSGSLTAGNRYKFRALKIHSEVLFWIAGSTEPAGKLSGCNITDGRNWTCAPNANPDAARSITLVMARGQPVADALHRTRSVHTVPKYRWLMAKNGVGLGSSADN